MKSHLSGLFGCEVRNGVMTTLEYTDQGWSRVVNRQRVPFTFCRSPDRPDQFMLANPITLAEGNRYKGFVPDRVEL